MTQVRRVYVEGRVDRESVGVRLAAAKTKQQGAADVDAVGDLMFASLWSPRDDRGMISGAVGTDVDHDDPFQ